MAETHTLDRGPTADLAAHIDRELGRLPAKYRAPVVLCDLEGKTRQEAARHLGWPEGTVAGRLVRARAMLAKRLSRYALGVSPAAVAAALADPAGALGPPPGVVQATRQNVLGPAAGLSPRVAALSDGVMRTMLVRKLQAVAVGLGLVLAAGLAVGAMAGRPKPDPGAPPPAGAARRRAAGPAGRPGGRAAGQARRPLAGRSRHASRPGVDRLEERGYLIDFDADPPVATIHRGQIRDGRSFHWSVEIASGAPTPARARRRRQGHRPIGRARSIDRCDGGPGITLTWDEPPANPRGRLTSPTATLALSRGDADARAPVALTVAPAVENLVGSRLTGTWEPEPDLARRLGVTAAGRLTVTADPAVAREVPAEYRGDARGQAHLPGRPDHRHPGRGDLPVPLGGTPGRSAARVLPAGRTDRVRRPGGRDRDARARGERDDDLLVLTAFDAATHAPAGGYRRAAEPKPPAK